jgi:hypothetical protein
MTWEVSDEELHGVLHATAEKQYAYFVDHTADWEEVWLVWRDDQGYGLMEFGEDPDDRSLAVWPHRRYVEACQHAGLWEDYEPMSMSVQAFVDELLPKVLAEGDDISVLPMADGRSVPVSVRRLRSDLDDALDR